MLGGKSLGQLSKVVNNTSCFQGSQIAAFPQNSLIQSDFRFTNNVSEEEIHNPPKAEQDHDSGLVLSSCFHPAGRPEILGFILLGRKNITWLLEEEITGEPHSLVISYSWSLCSLEESSSLSLVLHSFVS